MMPPQYTSCMFRGSIDSVCGRDGIHFAAKRAEMSTHNVDRSELVWKVTSVVPSHLDGEVPRI